MSYDNAVRHAVRTLKNPAPIPVHVEELPDKSILLHVDHKKVMQLPKPQRANFAAYLSDIVNIIETHGGVSAAVDMRGADGG